MFIIFEASKKQVIIMAQSAPHVVKRFTLMVFISFVIVFVFVMLMMLWHGPVSHDADGKTHYDTRVSEPTDGKGTAIF